MYTYSDGPVIKGNKEGLVIILDGRKQIQQVIDSLTKRIKASDDFFRNAHAAVKIMHQSWESVETESIRELLSHWDISVDSIVSGCQEDGLDDAEESVLKEAEMRKQLEDDILGLLESEPEKTTVQQVQPEAGNSKAANKDTSTSLIRRTLRSGQHVRYDGNVVVIGDVNPGAEITASGDILVFGSFRGVAHAGASGNEDAVVAALRLQATQLRIANYISRSPDERSKQPNRPEMARIRAGNIEIESFMI